MEVDPSMKQWRAHSNWRAHVAKYAALNKRKDSRCNPEQYCKSKDLNCEAFNIWLRFIEIEDKYTFYVSFATEYLSRAKRSLELLKKYMHISELCMPLMRDAVVAYAAPFSKSKGRIHTKPKWSLKEIESSIPTSLQNTHRKICDDRDEIMAHCDLSPRNPRVGLFGITLRGAGYYWADYQKLIPEFEKLILAVQEELQKLIIRENLISADVAFQDFSNPPTCAEEDPGPPSEKIS
jgi:hypothetical protein